ncbi:MAG TPA: hypothetical protein VFK05_27645, partial [Polyangiaceae bacterium]|nr:hypothetical protein [Polyangiaceae bacterium]
MKPAVLASCCLWLVGCAARPAGTAAEGRAAAVASATRASAPSSAGGLAETSALAPPAAGNAVSSAPVLPPPPLLNVKLVQLLSVPVSAIALGEGTRIAVLADVPYVGDARGLRPLPLPATLRPKPSEVDDLGIFFGRDNEPRIMGRRRGEAGERAVYLRHLPGGWRDGREEIGKLGG